MEKGFGYVQDVCADLETGKITSIIVPGGTNKILNFFSSNNDIIIRRFFDGRTQMEVADEIGISQAQVSRLEKSAINHIKRLYN